MRYRFILSLRDPADTSERLSVRVARLLAYFPLDSVHSPFVIEYILFAMYSRFALLVVALFVTLTTVNCGTIIHGTEQEIGFSSNPTGAKVTVDQRQMGTTPVSLDLDRGESHLIKMELEDYKPYETQVTKGVSGWVAGNIVFGGLIGLAVDAITGGMYKLTPEQISAELRDDEATASAAMKDGKVYITVVMKPNPEWEKIGQLEQAE